MTKENFTELHEELKAGSPWKEMSIFVDVDDTLIDHHDIVKPHVLKFLEHARERNCKLVLWSQGGADYCKEIATKLGIEHWFIAFLDKPDICLDDLAIHSKFIQACIHPMSLIGF